jgi:hypothetical protein
MQCEAMHTLVTSLKPSEEKQSDMQVLRKLKKEMDIIIAEQKINI